MNKRFTKGTILINAYSRDKSLKKCLESVSNSNTVFQYPVVVVLQDGFDEVERVLEDYSHAISKIIRVTGKNRTPLENINENRFRGYVECFENLEADWVLAIEEDVQISLDAVYFCVQMINKYHSHYLFRGINLGSREKFSHDLCRTYTRLRYGLHGQASVITKRTWQKIIKKNIQSKFKTHGFDSLVEYELKKGFMITPNNSRSIDTGWDGTHLPANQLDSYFVEMKESFVGRLEISEHPFQEFPLKHNWRADVEIFNLFRTPHFIFEFKWNYLKHFLKMYLD